MTNMRGAELLDAPLKRVENTFASPLDCKQIIEGNKKVVVSKIETKQIQKAFKLSTKYSQNSMDLMALTGEVGSPSGRLHIIEEIIHTC